MSPSRRPMAQRLAEILDRDVPEFAGIKLRWPPEKIYPARGVWRQSKMDVQQFQATAVDADRPDRMVLHAGCWENMTDVVRAGGVVLHDRWTLAPVREDRIRRQRK